MELKWPKGVPGANDPRKYLVQVTTKSCWREWPQRVPGISDKRVTMQVTREDTMRCIEMHIVPEDTAIWSSKISTNSPLEELLESWNYPDRKCKQWSPWVRSFQSRSICAVRECVIQRYWALAPGCCLIFGKSMGVDYKETRLKKRHCYFSA